MRVQAILPFLIFAGCSNDIQVAAGLNSAPTVSINAPADTSVFGEFETVEFQGTIGDSNGLDDIGVITWLSSVDGELSTPDIAAPDADGITRIATLLSPGVHAIILRATDSSGDVGEDSITVSIGVSEQAPLAEITEPLEFQEGWPNIEIDFIGTVSDSQEEAIELDVQWTVTPNGTTDTVAVFTGIPSANGVTTTEWTPLDVGNYIVELSVIDSSGEEGTASVLVVIGDPGDADLDGDGWTPNQGDCDDTDPLINPGAEEICGNALDDDCTADPTMVPPFDGIDDKDNDNDDHIDALCVNYTYGDYPVDDCDDDDASVYPGAFELADGIDNDCDGAIDNGGDSYDDDGDCYCEVGPCMGTIEPLCGPLLEGDCDDADPNVNPGASDDPDLMYTDSNCDGIDGDLTNSVFLDPITGSNGNNGLSIGSEVFDLDAAYSVALNTGRQWILLSEGVIQLTGDFQQGKNLAGGYEESNGWQRSGAVLPVISILADGKWLRNWNAATEWQQVEFRGGSTTNAGEVAAVLWLDNSQALTLNSCVVSSGNAGSGSAGSQPVQANAGNQGGNAGNGCEKGGCCGDWICGCSCCSQPQGGSGGSACTGGNNGGAGGLPGIDDGDGFLGTAGTGTGAGAGGAGGLHDGGSGFVGSPGSQGAAGTNGAGGAGIGTFGNTGYTAADGQIGGLGSVGSGGGGGGGGAGGGWTNGNCDTFGGGGGPGGGGGCGADGGTGGTGGGASVSIVLTNGSSVIMNDGNIDTGQGGSGGSGGNGGDGGNGATGKPGGLGETSTFGQESGDGGTGGNGGKGGSGGYGGGGGGGASVGIVCRDASTFTETAVVYSIGSGGSGGSSGGDPGQSGTQADTDGC